MPEGRTVTVPRPCLDSSETFGAIKTLHMLIEHAEKHLRDYVTVKELAVVLQSLEAQND